MQPCKILFNIGKLKKKNTNTDEEANPIYGVLS